MSRFSPAYLIYAYHQPLKLLRVWWQRPQSPAQLPGLLEHIGRAIERYAPRQLLLNLQDLPPLQQEGEQWLKSVWAPRLRQSGISRLALLLPADRTNLRVLESLLWEALTKTLPYEVQYFPDLPAALDWVTDAELPTTERHWARSWRGPALLRSRRRRRSRAALVG
ncbi:hypothetical protein KLP40_08425 [Hymenobacter sp. NST-14]|uniref:hypothetical protein n=1 Tax=Hymenobacter piscis TaxID=2839984 RepID=UPI001C00C401|nr:hypothetical protein [Hymenobacter piscis]MBT9393187.1 hypothetical protein [Hymenobacter piscis]